MVKYFFLISFFTFSLISPLSAQYRMNYLDMGRNAIADNNYTDAIQYLNNYINTFPTRYDGYYLRSIAKYYLNDLTGAEKDLTKAIDSWSRNADAYFLRGVVRSGRLEYEGALSDYAKAIQLDSVYTDAYFNRALTYYDMHDYSKALEDCNKVIKLNPVYKNIDVLHGLILARQRKFDEAIIDFCRSIDRYPMNVTAYVERGAAYMEVDKTSLAMQDFEKALRIDSLNTYAYFQRGLAYMQLGNYQQALKDFNHILEISPDNQLAYFNRAIINSNTNDETKAVNDFLNILRKNPDNMLVYYNLGVTLSKLGRYQLAIGSFDKAISLFPDYTDAYYARARAKLAIGDKSGALKDKTHADHLQQKNQEKSDSAKYKEGLQILKLTHLSGDFSSSKDTASENSQKKPDVKLSSFYNILLDPGVGAQIDGAYDCFGKDHYCLNSIALSKSGPVPDITLTPEKIELPDSLSITKNTSIPFLLRKGLFYSASGQLTKARENFDSILSIDPSDILAHFSRANLRLLILDNYLNSTIGTLSPEQEKRKQSLYLQAVTDYNTVLILDPEFYFARFNRGYLNFLMGKYGPAYADFNYIALSRQFPEAFFNKGLLAILLGENKTGCEDLSTAGQMGIYEAYPVIKKYCN